MNDEIVIIHPSGSAGEPEIFEPNIEVCLPGVLGDVGGRSEALWEWRSLDTSVKGPRSQTLRASTPVVRSVTMPGVRFLTPLDGPAGARAAYFHCRMVDVIIAPSLMLIVDDAASVSVRPEAFAHRWSMWSGHQVRTWCSCGLLFLTQ